MLHSFQPPQVYSPAHSACRASAKFGAEVATLSQQMSSIVAVCVLALRADLQNGWGAITISFTFLQEWPCLHKLL